MLYPKFNEDLSNDLPLRAHETQAFDGAQLSPKMHNTTTKKAHLTLHKLFTSLSVKSCHQEYKWTFGIIRIIIPIQLRDSDQLESRADYRRISAYFRPNVCIYYTQTDRVNSHPINSPAGNARLPHAEPRPNNPRKCPVATWNAKKKKKRWHPPRGQRGTHQIKYIA